MVLEMCYVVYIFYRILVERMQAYHSERSVQWHIPSKYSSEMSQKSDVVNDFILHIWVYIKFLVLCVGASWC